jgi:hypothetical protein
MYIVLGKHFNKDIITKFDNLKETSMCLRPCSNEMIVFVFVLVLFLFLFCFCFRFVLILFCFCFRFVLILFCFCFCFYFVLFLFQASSSLLDLILSIFQRLILRLKVSRGKKLDKQKFDKFDKKLNNLRIRFDS